MYTKILKILWSVLKMIFFFWKINRSVITNAIKEIHDNRECVQNEIQDSSDKDSKLTENINQDDRDNFYKNEHLTNSDETDCSENSIDSNSELNKVFINFCRYAFKLYKNDPELYKNIFGENQIESLNKNAVFTITNNGNDSLVNNENNSIPIQGNITQDKKDLFSFSNEGVQLSEKI